MSGLRERWQRSDQKNPFSQATLHDGNQLTAIPIVQWTCQGGALSVDLTLYHNAFDTPVVPFSPPPPPPPQAPPLGHGWRHSYLASLVEDAGTGNVTITEGDGRTHIFTKNPDSSYTRPVGIFESLVKNADATFRLTRKDRLQWKFNASGKLTSIVDLNGNSISFSYDASGRLSSLADPSGRTISFAYDANGFLASITDPLNRTFSFSYAGSPLYLWKVHEPSPSTLFIEPGYDANRRVTSIKDKRSNSWTFSYNATTRKVTSATNPESNQRSYFYGTGTQVTDENGNQVGYLFGGSGQVTRIDRYPVQQGPGVSDSFVYDADFNVTSNTKPSGAIWDYTWNGDGNLLTVEDSITRLDPTITRATFTYNSSNRVTSARDASAHQHNYSYSVQQNLTQVTDPAGKVTTYGYDAFGNRTSQTVNGKTTNFGYDSHGNFTSITDPLSNQTRFTYNALGWRTSRIDALNRTTNYTLDTMGRVTTVTYPDSTTTTHAYDGNGNRTSMADATGTTTWAYNSLNLVTSETKGPDSISYIYDAGGRRTSLTDQTGDMTSFEHDGMNRMSKASRGPTWNATYERDANSNLTSQTNPNETTVTLSYNSADWLTSIVNKKSDGSTLSSFTYGYNTDGLRSSVSEADGSQVAYGYDALHRLTSETRTGTNSYTITYGYDPAGNRLNKVLNGVGTSYAYDDANRLLSAGSTTYAWNANGNLTSKTEGGVTTDFGYDFDDQLASIAGPTTVSFGYDGLGHRVTRTDAGATTTFLHDGKRITTEKQGTAATAHFAYGLDRLSRDNGTNFRYYLVDGLGSTRQLTDESEAVFASYVFEGFGILVAQSGSTVNPYKFAETSNYRDDGDAGLIHVGARYYDIQVGRFTSADPTFGDILDPQSLNRYIYVQNNPVNLLDPSGLSWLQVLRATLGVLGRALGAFILANPGSFVIIVFVVVVAGVIAYYYLT